MKIIYITITMLLLLIANHAFAECWVVSGLKGYGSNAADKFNIHEDGLSDKKIHITINGNKSSVTGSEGISFKEVTPQLIVGVYKSGGYKGTVESWEWILKIVKPFIHRQKAVTQFLTAQKCLLGYRR